MKGPRREAQGLKEVAADLALENRIPDKVRAQIVELALQAPELSPRELAVRFTDQRKYFVSETFVHRLLKAPDLITSPAYVLIKAADRSRQAAIVTD